MPAAEEFDQVAPGIFVWQAYDRTVKADLFSTALETAAGLFLVDPILLGPNWLALPFFRSKMGGIIVTNENHWRATSDFAARFSIPVHLYSTLLEMAGATPKSGLEDKSRIAPGLTAIAIEGAPPGEIAVHHDEAGGTIVLGDALINFEPHGFGLLPAKYCSDFKLMRRSLPKLLDYPFERILFAHGTPILSEGRERLATLLRERP
jgi:hypothetical protein